MANGLKKVLNVHDFITMLLQKPCPNTNSITAQSQRRVFVDNNTFTKPARRATVLIYLSQKYLQLEMLLVTRIRYRKGFVRQEF